MKRLIASLIVASVVLTFAAPVLAAPGNLILQVPDWNQPTNYGVVGYPNWCSPTAGGNLMGYWDDVKGFNQLTDNQAFAASPVYPANGGSWEQGLYHDGMIEMGWHMDTGTWKEQVPAPGFPPNAGGTAWGNILPGLLGYAHAGWTDDDFGPGNGTGIVKVAYPNATGYTDVARNAQMWSNYRTEIDAARPVEVGFQHWVLTVGPGGWLGNTNIDGFGQTIEKYGWDVTVDPHSVVGVGYIDVTPGFQGGGDEMFVCQDGWPGPGQNQGGWTGQYVAVPVDTMWVQNDYITAIPEPTTFALLVAGAVSALIYGWHRRKRA